MLLNIQLIHCNVNAEKTKQSIKKCGMFPGTNWRRFNIEMFRNKFHEPSMNECQFLCNPALITGSPKLMESTGV